MAINESIDIFFVDGIPATWTPSFGGVQQTANVIVDAPDIINNLGGFDMHSTDRMMSYAATAFVGLFEGEAVAIGGVAYRVRGEPMAIGDGAVMQARLGLWS